MGKFVDLTGRKFNRWTVLRRAPKVEGSVATWWVCQCECGGVRTVTGGSLTSNASKSCGCFNLERIVERNTKHGCTPRGGTTREYSAWCAIKARCGRATNRGSSYTDKGISVCSRWLNSFDDFLADMGPAPTRKHQIDRIDNDGDYEPGNCRWLTCKQNMRNTSKNVHVTYNGETRVIAEWAELLGINYSVLRSRLRSKNFTVEEAFTKPVGSCYGPKGDNWKNQY